MPVKKAVSLFTGSGENQRMNCAQAVAGAFKNKFGLSDELIERLVSSGSGKAPDGVCGALYAAQVILDKVGKGKTTEAIKFFSEHAGSVYCAEIRRVRKVSCVGCVKKAASILDQEVGSEDK
jgi:hypothetical protein